MKRALLVALIALLVPTSASAAIPNIQETAQYKNLKNYTNFLKSQATTPVTAEQKEIYQNNLNQKSVNTQARVNSLYQARKNKLTKNYKKNQKKAIKKINKVRNKNLKTAKNKYNQDINYDKSVYKAAVSAINNNYKSKVNPINKKIKKIKKQLNKTISPEVVTSLRLQLESLLLEKQSFKEAKRTSLDIAVTNYQKTIADEKRAYKKRAKKINRLADRNINKQKKTRKAKLNQYINNAKNRRSKEQAVVNSLTATGQIAINSMPPVVS
jgi:hypothetical protein